MPFSVTIEQEALQKLSRELKKHGDGKLLRRELNRELRAAGEPTKREAQANLHALSTPGGPSPAVTADVARRVKTESRLSGRQPGARVRLRKGGPRKFEWAGRRLNRKRGFRHRVFGRDVWVRQVASQVEWFDRATRAHRKDYRAAAVDAIEKMLRKIKVRG